MLSHKTCLLCCLVFVAHCVQDSYGSLSRQKRFNIGNLLDGLQNTFDSTVDTVLGLVSDEFDRLLDNIGDLAKGSVERILSNFRLFSNSHQDLSGDRGEKLGRIMIALNDNMQNKTSGSALADLSMSATVVSLLATIVLV